MVDMEEIEDLKTQIAEKAAEVQALQDELEGLYAEYDEAVSELIEELEA